MGSPKAYRFQPEARLDLAAIWSFSFERWGEETADGYVNRLRQRVVFLAGNPRAGRMWRGVEPPVRVLTAGSHVIVYRERDDWIEVVRIMHQRQNWQAILGE